MECSFAYMYWIVMVNHEKFLFHIDWFIIYLDEVVENKTQQKKKLIINRFIHSFIFKHTRKSAFVKAISYWLFSQVKWKLNLKQYTAYLIRRIDGKSRQNWQVNNQLIFVVFNVYMNNQFFTKRYEYQCLWVWYELYALQIEISVYTKLWIYYKS